MLKIHNCLSKLCRKFAVSVEKSRLPAMPTFLRMTPLLEDSTEDL